MQLSSIPAKIAAIFAASAPSLWKNTVPLTQAETTLPGQASFDVGFPSTTMQPLGSGGILPFGQDFNGILNALSAVEMWKSAGGTFPYDAAYSSAIGGYPKGAVLLRADIGGFWLSQVDNNVTNPDTGGAGWVPAATLGLTQPRYDSSKFLATTEFVANAGVRFSAFGSIPGGSATLAITDLPKIISILATGQTVTLPPVTNVHAGAVQRIFVYPGSANKITVFAPSGQLISAGTTLTSSIDVAASGHVDFVWEGTGSNNWEASGVGLLNKSPDFAATYSGTGQQSLPGGLILKWGSYNLGNLAAAAVYSGNIVFPTAFPSSCFSAQITSSDRLMRAGLASVAAGSISGVFQNDYTATQPIAGSYFAIGK